jgi:hypothetical protein
MNLWEFGEVEVELRRAQEQLRHGTFSLIQAFSRFLPPFFITESSKSISTQLRKNYLRSHRINIFAVQKPLVFSCLFFFISKKKRWHCCQTIQTSRLLSKLKES